MIHFGKKNSERPCQNLIFMLVGVEVWLWVLGWGLFVKVLTLVAIQLVLAYSRISSPVLALLTFCQHNIAHRIIPEREAPNCTLPVSMHFSQSKNALLLKLIFTKIKQYHHQSRGQLQRDSPQIVKVHFSACSRPWKENS